MKMTPIKEAKIKADFEAIVEALKQTNFHKGKAAKLLGVDSKTVYNKLRRYKLLTGIGETEKAS